MLATEKGRGGIDNSAKKACSFEAGLSQSSGGGCSGDLDIVLMAGLTFGAVRGSMSMQTILQSIDYRPLVSIGIH